MEEPVGKLYLSALDSSAPALLLVICGIIVAVLNIFPPMEYALMSVIAFKFGLPIRGIYIIANNEITRQDWLIVASIMAITALSSITILPFVLFYPRAQRFKAFSAIFCVLSVNNCVISGIPVFSGMYDEAMVQKYAYLQLLACFGLCLVPVFIFFELSSANQQSNTALRRQGAHWAVLYALSKTVQQPLIICVVLGLIGNALVFQAGMVIPACFVHFFDHMGFLSAPLGLIMLGMYFYVKIWLQRVKRGYTGVSTRNVCVADPTAPSKEEKRKQLVGFVVVSIYIQLMRHLIMPIGVVGFCRLFGIEQVTPVELSAGIYASPTAVFSFVVCNQYGFGEGIAGLDAVLGLVTGFLVIPVLQLFTRALWKS